jgi:ATP-dependent helicase/nuclease subunit A
MAEKYTDTREQSLAQCYDRHISVTANAGSGKTTVLEKRFINLLLNKNFNIEPRRLIAITFTRKASAEIFSRIARSIESIIKDEPISGSLHSKLLRLRERLNTSQISTIHSFCSSLLRDFPIEADVQPNFYELSEAEKLKIQSEAITTVIASYLRDKTRYKEINQLIRIIGRQKTESFIRGLINNRDTYEKIKILFMENNDINISENTIKFILQFLKNKHTKTLNSILDVINQIISLDIDEEKKEILNVFIMNIENIILIINQLDSFSFEKNIIYIKAFIDSINKLCENKIFTQKLVIAKPYLGKFTDKGNIDIYNYNLKDFDKLVNFVNSLMAYTSQLEIIKYARLILEITENVLKEIAKLKNDTGALDFDDIIIRTRDMLHDKVVAEKIAHRYSFIMVDEFQDTNDIQYEIIKSLIPQLIASEKKYNIKLFIVGDPKQSIYGFRNADVRVFTKAKEDIRSANQYLLYNNIITAEMNTPQGIKKELNSNESMGNIELLTSFRHYPVISAFTNIICRRIMAEKESEFDVDYSPLVCSRMVPELLKFSENNNEIKSLPEEFGSIKILISRKKNNNGETLSEADLLALCIRNLVTNDNNDKEKNKFSDIAVLVRARNNVGLLIEAFQKYNIPYILHSGKGFFETQEIKDILSILKFINNPKDDLSLTAALRSPYFGLSDNDILNIISCKNHTSLWEALKTFITHTEKSSLIIKRSYDILSELLHYASRMDIGFLISHIIEICGWNGIVEGKENSEQIIANLNKFKYYASDFEKRGFKNIYDFIEEMELISKENVMESEAVFITDENAVNIMTIHAAKGLEFPIVALFDTTYSRNHNSDLYVDEELGLAFKFHSQEKNSDKFQEVETPLFHIAKEKETMKEKAELKRLLYVAMTRAKKRLIITANFCKTSNSNSFFNFICDGLDYDFSDDLKNNLSFEEDIQLYHENSVISKKIKFDIDIIENIHNKNEIKIENIIPQEPVLLLNEIIGKTSEEVYSATKFMSFFDGRDNYLKKYLLGIEDNKIFKSILIEKADSPDISGTDTGIIIHNILENIDKWMPENGNIAEDILDNYITNITTQIIANPQQEFIAGIRNEILNVVATKLVQNNAKVIHLSEKELSLKMPFKEDFLNAKIDLLLKYNSHYEIWDWKSNRVENVNEMISSADHYKFQMKLYACFLKFLKPELLKFKARLLFTYLASPKADDKEWTVVFEWDSSELDKFLKEVEKEMIKMKSLLV